MTTRIIWLFILLLSMNVAGQQDVSNNRLKKKQSTTVDSLITELSKTNDSKERSWIYFKLVKNFDQERSQREKWLYKGLAESDNYPEVHYRMINQAIHFYRAIHDSVIFYADEYINYARERGDEKGLLNGFVFKGVYLSDLTYGKNKKAKIGLRKAYLDSALMIAQDPKYSRSLIEINHRLSDLYSDLGDTVNQRFYLETAQELVNAIDPRERKPFEQMIIAKKMANQGDLQGSIEYLEPILKEELSGDWRSYIHAVLVEFKSRNGDLEGAYEEYKMGIQIARKYELSKELLDNYGALIEAYEEHGKYKEAYLTYKEYTAKVDSLNGDEMERTVNDLEEYKRSLVSNQKTKELEYENELGKLEAQKQSRNLWIAFSASGGLLFLGMLLFVMFYRKRKALEESEHLQKELSAQKERAERSEAFKQQFLANMSHEIRTPMNAVLGMTNLVLDTELTDKQRSYLEKVKISSDNLLHIINDILDLSKVESGKMELEQIDFSLKETLELIKHTLELKAEEKGLTLLMQMDEGVEDVVIGDPIRLNQVLLNLTNNALKFTEQGSVLIKLSNAESKIRFEVTDTGIGIPKDKIEQVFESFQQANASDTRQYGGTGLGLTISQQLIHLMGGEISIDSEVGKGTTFSFELKLEKGDEKRYAQRKNQTMQLDGSVLNGLTVLLADDNEYNRIVARDTLEGIANVTVIEAENGQEVIEKLGDDVDVILMDVQMPVMSGFEATKEIRESDTAYSNIPIIALTASVLRSDLDKCKDAGMNAYVPKPFRTFELIKAIAEVLKLKVKEKEVNTPKSKERIIDLDHLHDFCDGDEKKIAKYKKLFLEGAEEFISELDDLLEKEDAIAIADLVHKFNTRLSLMGMKEAKDLSVKIENSLRSEGILQDMSEEIDKLKQQVLTGLYELRGN